MPPNLSPVLAVEIRRHNNKKRQTDLLNDLRTPGRAIRLWNPETITVNSYGHNGVTTVNRLAVTVKKPSKTR